MLSSKRFLVSAVIYLSCLPNLSYSCMWCEIELHFNSFACAYPLVQAPFFKGTVLCWSWNPCRKLADYRCMVLFLDSNSIPLVYMSIYIPALHCFVYCRLVTVAFEIMMCESSDFVTFSILLWLFYASYNS